jgi:hypothetical protein
VALTMTAVGERAGDSKSRKSPVAETVLVVLFGLIAKAALDQSFSAVSHLDGLMELWRAFAANIPLHLLLAWQLFVFFFTLFRFFLGSVKHYELREGYKSLGPLVVDMLLTVILFTGFYLTALAMRHPVNFCLMVVLMHLVDVAWFFLSWLVGSINEKHQAVLKSFVIFDIFTVLSFVVIGLIFNASPWGLGPPYWGVVLCLVVLLAVGVVDFVKHKNLYLGTVQ